MIRIVCSIVGEEFDLILRVIVVIGLIRWVFRVRACGVDDEGCKWVVF